MEGVGLRLTKKGNRFDFGDLTKGIFKKKRRREGTGKKPTRLELRGRRGG